MINLEGRKGGKSALSPFLSCLPAFQITAASGGFYKAIRRGFAFTRKSQGNRNKITLTSQAGFPGGARDSRSVSGDPREIRRGAWANPQAFKVSVLPNLDAVQEPIPGCLRRAAADRTRVACSTRKLRPPPPCSSCDCPDAKASFQ